MGSKTGMKMMGVTASVLVVGVLVAGCSSNGDDEVAVSRTDAAVAEVETDNGPGVVEAEEVDTTDMTRTQENAVKQAESYLSHSAFSRQGLIEQLEFGDYSTEDAVFAVDYVDPDWNEQSAKQAESYLSHSAFSRQGLIDQLVFSGYTPEQAEYGADQAGLD